MAVMGLRLAQRANGVAQLHGEVSRGMFNGLWPRFDTDEVPIASVTNGVHAPTWVAREVLELAARAVGRDLVEEAAAGRRSSAIPDGEIWGVAAHAARPAGRRGALAAAGVLAAARRQRRRAGLGRRGPRPRRAHHRLRPPGAVLQAADADAARPGAAEVAAAAPDPAGADRRRRQGAPGRRRRQEADPAAGRSSPTTRACGTGSCSCPTTTSPWRSRSTRAATSG